MVKSTFLADDFTESKPLPVKEEDKTALTVLFITTNSTKRDWDEKFSSLSNKISFKTSLKVYNPTSGLNAICKILETTQNFDGLFIVNGLAIDEVMAELPPNITKEKVVLMTQRKDHYSKIYKKFLPKKKIIGHRIVDLQDFLQKNF